VQVLRFEDRVKPKWPIAEPPRLRMTLDPARSDDCIGPAPGPVLRLAQRADVPALQSLIARSARALGPPHYTAAQIEGALRGAFGVDSQLIDDGSYFVAEAGGELLGCGGWSRRVTLFGGDAHALRNDAVLDPATAPARIRAFFVDPGAARRGIGKALLQRCEAEAVAWGYHSFELMATLPGVPLYAACGYAPGVPLSFPLEGELTISFVPMRKSAG
jgi:GNAT superfamily N-acetyltransferase